MHGDLTLFLRQLPVDEHLHRTLLIVECAQRRHRAGYQAELVHQLFRRRKAQRAHLVRTPKGLEIDALFTFNGDEDIALLFVVPNEQVLRLRFRPGHLDFRKLRHIANRFVLHSFKSNAAAVQQIVNLLFVHRFTSQGPPRGRHPPPGFRSRAPSSAARRAPCRC